MKNIKVLSGSTPAEIQKRTDFYNLFKESPVSEKELMQNLGLYINRQSLSRLLFMNELYLKILNVHGIVMEFGVRWGQNMVLFNNFRGIYEPYNYNRKIIGFDTFEGFPEIHAKDGDKVQNADYGVSEDYDLYLGSVLEYHESESPIPNKRKFEIIKGDAPQTLERYLKDNPQTIIAMAYFDFDIYLPTKKCLELIRDRVTRGSVIAFDELNCPEFPGETLALKEVLGLDRYAIRRSNLNPLISYLVVD